HNHWLTVEIMAGTLRLIGALRGERSCATENPTEARIGSGDVSKPKPANPYVSVYDSTFSLVASYILGHYDAALRAADSAETLFADGLETILEAKFRYFHALTLTSRMDSLDGRNASAAAKVREHADQLAEFSSLCPDNFLHLHALIVAEL